MTRIEYKYSIFRIAQSYTCFSLVLDVSNALMFVALQTDMEHFAHNRKPFLHTAQQLLRRLLSGNRHNFVFCLILDGLALLSNNARPSRIRQNTMFAQKLPTRRQHFESSQALLSHMRPVGGVPAEVDVMGQSAKDSTPAAADSFRDEACMALL